MGGVTIPVPISYYILLPVLFFNLISFLKFIIIHNIFHAHDIHTVTILCISFLVMYILLSLYVL